jgi:peptidoglycan/LPS O-acetylase OafA/YrhL
VQAQLERLEFCDVSTWLPAILAGTMRRFQLTPSASAHLDMVRGIAAIEVMIWHFRAVFFVPYGQVQQKTAVNVIWYMMTCLPHQAVVVFFVLSGLFIAPAVLESVGSGGWSWKRYGANRLSRLYVVLIPALLITAAFDRLGRLIPGGQDTYFNPLPYNQVSVLAASGWSTFLGNLFFVESILCGTFGSDSPLWSLS